MLSILTAERGGTAEVGDEGESRRTVRQERSVDELTQTGFSGTLGG